MHIVCLADDKLNKYRGSGSRNMDKLTSVPQVGGGTGDNIPQRDGSGGGEYM